MRIRVQTLMIIVALMSIGFATTDPITVLLLMFGCPLWFVLFARMQGGRNPGPPETRGVPDGFR